MTATFARGYVKYISDRQEQISETFERFNPYAVEARRLEENEDEAASTYAQLATAFEISQLRYQMTRGNNVNNRP